MEEIEQNISPLIQSMFPSFYQEDGENFIAFIESYYEFLEQNYQVLVLTDIEGFSVGDTVYQGETAGVIIAVDESGANTLLVRLDSFDTFRCFDINTEFELVTSSSGAESYILHGGKGKRVTPLYWARNLFKLRDIDQTIDSFILNFKEKYLKNIEFDISTNKQLLVKNSLDLYRSKGTERAVDLFFRLIYGVKAQVYYPGDDLFKLSAAEWVKPRYIEITSSDRTVDLVGRQIVGVASGATAFVEKYVKRRVKNSFVYVLYVSNVSGQFETDEIIRYDEIYPDLPKVKGSLTGVTIINGSRDFAVGDIVYFSSSRGDFGMARVSAISSVTGQVDFIFEDGGYGYTLSSDPAFTDDDLKKRTQSLVSEKVLVLKNVRTSNAIGGISVTAGGTGYDNTDIVYLTSDYLNCTATPTTNSVGGILYITINEPGSGFYVNNPSPVLISNSIGGATGGSGATLVATSKAHSNYFKYFEDFNQVIKTVEYDSASNNQLFLPGSTVTIGNDSVTVASGVIIDNANNTLVDANGILTISISNNRTFDTGNTITLTSNQLVNAVASVVTDNSADAKIMGVPRIANLSFTGNTAAFVAGDEIFQTQPGRGETANATVESFTTGAGMVHIDVTDLKGVFVSGGSIGVRNKDTTALLTDIELTVGLYDINNAFLLANGEVFSTNTGTTANLLNISQGSGAAFRVGSLTETEIIYLNTDLVGGNNISDTPYLSLNLDANEFGFPKAPTGNLSTIIFTCLNFDSFEIGTIGTLTNINPGSDYTLDPYVLAYQPYLAAFNRYDYIFEIENVTGSFLVGERLLQTNTLLTTHTLMVDNDDGFEPGMKVHQGDANGFIIEVTDALDTLTLRDVQGTFAVNSTPLLSYSNGSITANITNADTDSVVSTAKGIVKFSNNSHIGVKRIQFANYWSPTLEIRGVQSGTTANIVSVEQDTSYLPIGLNANIIGNVITAEGTVSNLEILDSGLGYRDNDEIIFISTDGSRAGSGITDVRGVGTGSGYYRTSKGFLSSVSKLQDGDFYQEYSYEIISRIPLDKYSEMFKKVMHAAGTRYFGGVLLETNLEANVAYANSQITLT